MRNVLVTGASTGIGQACVNRLAERGWRVFASVRRPADADRLRQSAAGRVTPLLFDLTDERALRGACDQVVAECGEAGLHGVVNNAGIAVAGPLEFLPVAELRRQLDVNVVAQVAVAQAVLPALRRARGRLVLIGSIAGRSAMPFMAPYAASKHALEAVADAWRVELAPWGMKVVLIEPGVIATPIWETSLKAADTLLAQLPAQTSEYYGPILEGMRRRIGRGLKGLPAAAVARVVEQALTSARPKARYLIGRDARIRIWLKRLPTSLQDRIITRGLERL